MKRFLYKTVTLPFLVLSCLSCGLFGLGSFDQTPPPRATFSLSIQVENAPATLASVTVIDAAGRILSPIATVENIETPLDQIPLNTSIIFDLGPQDFSNILVFAEIGTLSLKGVVPQIIRDTEDNETVPVDAGVLNIETTIASQLLARRIASDGSGFEGTPAEIVRALYEKGQDRTIPAVDTFSELVQEILNASDPLQNTGSKAFEALSENLSSEFLFENGLLISVEEYNEALALAAEAIKIPLVCDSSLVSVFFTVDISGQALDGNGRPQFIRQPPREGKVFLAISLDPSSPISDTTGLLKAQLTPNDITTVMFDDGTNGDEIANDGVFSRLLVLPRGMRVIYKYTNGAAGEGFTRTEEWPGNARILEIEDRLSKNSDGSPDCLVIRRDSFGDEASNKNFVNLNSEFSSGGGTLSFDTDLGGENASEGSGGLIVGGLALGEIRQKTPLTPAGISEAKENGICLSKCPPPVVAPTDDRIAPVLSDAEWIGDREIVATFSESVDLASATNPANWLLIDDLSRALRINSIGAVGAKVSLRTEPANFSRTYTLHVQKVTDASADQNAVEDDDIPDFVEVKEDQTPPKVLRLQTQSLKDINPGANLVDPTLGHVVKIDFNEALQINSAQNVSNYAIVSSGGAPLAINAAIVGPQGRSVQLITETQAKGLSYRLQIDGVRDISGNTLRQDADDTLEFQGFALFRVTFGVVVDFAFANEDGSSLGLPFGEDLYLTGTPLAIARALDASSIALGGRTDVTGVPAFEMTPSTDTIDGASIYRISLLVPPGVYAWKAAHGIAGEFLTPPPTLEKVHKNLATTNDATGVTVDPRTLLAANGVDYTGATLSITGNDPESPTVLFKRENPDEVCTVTDRDVTCPTIIVGTWRDILINDYDDGERELEPIRPEIPDAKAPALLANIVRDSESILLSFDESLGGEANDLELTLQHAKTGEEKSVQVEAYGGPLLPNHQTVIRINSPLENGAVYNLRFRGQKDLLGNREQVIREVPLLAPATFIPFTPLIDEAPPQIVAINTPSPTEVLLIFNEKVDPVSAGSIASYQIIESNSGTLLTITEATLTGAGQRVLLTTAPQIIEESYELSAVNVFDLAGNVLPLQIVPFLGFGDQLAPQVLRAEALSPTQVLVQFDEALDPFSAEQTGNYAIPGLTIFSAEYSGSPALGSSAFAGNNAPRIRDLVLLTTSSMPTNTSLGLQVVGVQDESGNTTVTGSNFDSVAAPRKVTVVLEYLISATTPVNGQIPSRAISLQRLATEREGVFLRGSEVSSDGSTLVNSSVTVSLGEFPPEGQPLDGPEPVLLDDGQGFDALAGDGRFTIAIPNVPLGATIIWKGFASFSVAYRDANPGDLFAAFADETPGPSVFSDGQEFPGNDNAVRVLGDPDGDGIVKIQALFGDEITYKRFTGTPAFLWLDGEFSFE